MTMGPLVFIANQNQWKALAVQCALPPDAVIASLDFALAEDLREKGYSVLCLQENQQAADSREVEDRAYDVVSALREALRGKVMYGRADIGERSANDLLVPMRMLQMQLRLVSRVLTDVRPPEVWCFKEKEQVTQWDVGDPPPDGFNAVVAWLAAREGIPVRRFAEAGRSAKQYNQSAHTQPLTNTGVGLLGRHVSLICWCPGPMFKEQELFIEHLARQKRQDVLVISDTCTVAGLPCLHPRDLLKLPFVIQTFSDSLDPWQASDVLLSILESALSDPVPPGFALTMWQFLCESMKRAACLYAAGRFLCNALRPGVLLCGYDIGAGVRCLELAFELSGIPTIMADHAGIPIENSMRRHTGARAHAAAFGLAGMHGHQRYRAPGALVRPIGTLRRDIAAQVVAATTEGSTTSLGQPIEAMGIVLFSGAMIVPWGGSSKPSRVLETWSDLASLAARRSDWRITVKSHPRKDYPTVYQRAAANHESALQVSTTQDNGVLLASARAAVIVNTRSTVAVECILRGVPTFYLRDAMFDDAFYSWEFADDCLETVNSVEALEQGLDRLGRDADWRQALVARAKAGLRDYLAATGDEAVARMEAFLAEVMPPRDERAIPHERLLFDLLFMGCGRHDSDPIGLKPRGQAPELAACGPLDPAGVRRLIWERYLKADALTGRGPLTAFRLWRSLPDALQLEWREFVPILAKIAGKAAYAPQVGTCNHYARRALARMLAPRLRNKQPPANGRRHHAHRKRELQ